MKIKSIEAETNKVQGGGGGGGDWGCRESQLSRKKEIFFLKKSEPNKSKKWENMVQWQDELFANSP